MSSQSFIRLSGQKFLRALSILCVLAHLTAVSNLAHAQELDLLSDSGVESSPEPAPAVDESEVASPDPQPTPVPNSRALDESGLSNPIGQGDFKRPLLFAPEDNDFRLENPQLKWMMDQNSASMNIGGLRIDQAALRWNIDQTPRSSTRSKFQEDGESELVTNMSFGWPTMMTSSGTLSIEPAKGKAVWREKIERESLEEWKNKLASREKNELVPHARGRWGLLDLRRDKFEFLWKGGTFRICLTKQNSKTEAIKICSPFVRVVSQGGRLQTTEVKSTQEANFYIYNKPVGPNGQVNFPLGRDIRFKTVFANGAYLEVASQPAKLELLDAVASKDGREIILTGRGQQPLGKKKIISKPETHFWAVSGIQQDTVYQTALPIDAPTLRVLGAFNVPFTYIFEFEKLPKESDRVYIRERGTTGTYSETPHIEGYVPAGDTVTSKERSATKTEATRFEWKFGAPKAGEMNRSRISVLDKKTKQNLVAHHSIYRGYPFEASGRLTGVITPDGSTAIIGEVAASAWFENLGFSQNEWLSRQRWGVTARYFKTLTPIGLSGGQSIDDFSVMNADLKYNLVRGVWNRDELFGLVGSVESISIAGLSANLAGFGGYWARTMPKVFAQIFDLFPYLDYSKYVDVEFIYYPVSLTSGIEAGGSFNLNFHGKVFWTSRVYGEAGFGLKRFDFADRSKNSSVSFSTGYGTVGLGYIF